MAENNWSASLDSLLSPYALYANEIAQIYDVYRIVDDQTAVEYSALRQKGDTEKFGMVISHALDEIQKLPVSQEHIVSGILLLLADNTAQGYPGKPLMGESEARVRQRNFMEQQAQDNREIVNQLLRGILHQ